jgi:hypothetical protein
LPVRLIGSEPIPKETTAFLRWDSGSTILVVLHWDTSWDAADKFITEVMTPRQFAMQYGGKRVLPLEECSCYRDEICSPCGMAWDFTSGIPIGLEARPIFDDRRFDTLEALRLHRAANHPDCHSIVVELGVIWIKPSPRLDFGTVDQRAGTITLEDFEKLAGLPEIEL